LANETLDEHKLVRRILSHFLLQAVNAEICHNLAQLIWWCSPVLFIVACKNALRVGGLENYGLFNQEFSRDLGMITENRLRGSVCVFRPLFLCEILIVQNQLPTLKYPSTKFRTVILVFEVSDIEFSWIRGFIWGEFIPGGKSKKSTMALVYLPEYFNH
jgi:hypothetical protein